MHLGSLTLKGFKSFANPTRFEFEPGVTCVVGPNGSGKSNVVDALAWVMGEQGAKNLRGGKMEDVIFAGTTTRGPLGRAEVTLTIDNSDGVLPIEYAEVTIRRTLFRNGGSEYAINGEQVRLLDVQELLSDTGLGREMHVIVGQGRLDSVLHATPEERRGFIEEAAGILKHRRRKEKTLRKLDGMEANLTRLRDLASEVRRQLKPLGRQAEVARKAQGIAAIARDAKARLMADEVVRLGEAIRAATASEQEVATERQVLQERLEAAVATAERIAAEQRRDAVDAARRQVFELESAHERLRNLQSLAVERRALVVARLETPAFTPTTTQAEVEAARDEARDATERGVEAEAAWQAAQRATAAAREARDAHDQEIAAQSARIQQHDLRLAEHRGKADAAAQRLASVRGEVLRQRNARDAAAERLRVAREVFDEIAASAEQDEADSSELDAAYRVAQERAAECERARDALRDRVHEGERERDALEARVAALSLAADAQDATAALLDAGIDGVDGAVVSSVRVRDGHEAAVAAALGSAGEAVLARSADVAFALLDHARSGELGRVEAVAPVAAFASLASPAGGTDDGAGGGLRTSGENTPTDRRTADLFAHSPGLCAAGASRAAIDRMRELGLTPVLDVVDAPDAVLAVLACSAIAPDLASARAAFDALAASTTGADAASYSGSGSFSPEPDSGSSSARAADSGSSSRRPDAETRAPAGGASSAPERVAADRALLPLLRVATPSGEVVTATSVLGGSGTAGTSRLEIMAERDRAATRLDEVRERVDREALELADRRGELHAAKTAAQSALDALRAFDADLASRRERRNTAAARVDAATSELERAAKALTASESQISEVEQRATEAKRAHEELAAIPRPVLDASRREEFAGAAERARDAEVEARLHVETLRERARAESLRAEQLARRLEADRAAAEAAARETVQRRHELARVEQVLELLPRALDVAIEAVTEARTELARVEAERQEQDAELQRARAEESRLRARLHELSQSVYTLELQIAEQRMRRQNVIERVGSELHLDETTLVTEYGPHVPVPDDDALRGTGEREADRISNEAASVARAELEEEHGEPVRAVREDAAERADGDGHAGDEGGAGGGRDRGSEPETGTKTAGRPSGAAAAPPAAAGAGAAVTGVVADPVDPDLAAAPVAGGTARALEEAAALAAAGRPFVRAEQEKRLAEAERRMAQLGRINPLALEEFAALEQRHAFLVDQLDDLAKTRSDLLRIVSDIDEHMKTVFEAAFIDTREAFHTVFPILFPGGEGDLSLTQPDDMLATGIEVSVRPAGKKIERLSLLSGGERSLAAVALLIAIFKARPSPFYIMDEVEAALDDANLGRLLQVFEDLRETSQLIVITHQKRTMEIADALYGVSMRQDGVSAVVGQRIARDGAESTPEPAAVTAR